MDVALYVLGFNSPTQFKKLIDSYLASSGGMIARTTNYLIDNSTDVSTTQEYANICAGYNFHHIKKDNLGICGGRQFIAEHFESSTKHDAYIFLEDDMQLVDVHSGACRLGFCTYVPHLFDKVIKITKRYKYDFLKFSFCEFFGDNSTQWAWYNVPQHVRESYWPDNCTLPTEGTSKTCPSTQFKNVHTIDGTSFVDGEVYYCNWPQIVTRDGNRKMFLETMWAHPYEQTWMSYMYQKHREGWINGAVLLASPVHHDRFEHYSADLRKES